MPTYAGLQYGDVTNLAGLREDIYYLAKVNSGFIGANDINRIINKYYAKVQERIRKVNENFYMIVATADLYIGDGSYTYPDGSGGGSPPYEKLKAVFAAYNPADKANVKPEEYVRCNVADPTSISNPSYAFTIPTVLPFGTYFVLLPLVTDATKYPVIKGVKIYYIAAQLKLVNDVDFPLIFPSFHDAIVLGSLIDVNHRKGDDKAEAEAKVAFDQRMKDIESYASDHLPQEVGVVEGQDNQGGWIYPWDQGNKGM